MSTQTKRFVYETPHGFYVAPANIKSVAALREMMRGELGESDMLLIPWTDYFVHGQFVDADEFKAFRDASTDQHIRALTDKEIDDMWNPPMGTLLQVLNDFYK